MQTYLIHIGDIDITRTDHFQRQHHVHFPQSDQRLPIGSSARFLRCRKNLALALDETRSDELPTFRQLHKRTA